MSYMTEYKKEQLENDKAHYTLVITGFQGKVCETEDVFAKFDDSYICEDNLKAVITAIEELQRYVTIIRSVEEDVARSQAEYDKQLQEDSENEVTDESV